MKFFLASLDILKYDVVAWAWLISYTSQLAINNLEVINFNLWCKDEDEFLEKRKLYLETQNKAISYARMLYDKRELSAPFIVSFIDGITPSDAEKIDLYSKFKGGPPDFRARIEQISQQLPFFLSEVLNSNTEFLSKCIEVDSIKNIFFDSTEGREFFKKHYLKSWRIDACLGCGILSQLGINVHPSGYPISLSQQLNLILQKHPLEYGWLCAIIIQKIVQNIKNKIGTGQEITPKEAVNIQSAAIQEVLDLYHRGQLTTNDLIEDKNFKKPPGFFLRLYGRDNHEKFREELSTLWNLPVPEIPFVFKREARDIFEVPEEVFNLANKYGFDSREHDEFIVSAYNLSVHEFLNGSYKLYIERVAETSFIEYEEQKSVLSEVLESPQNPFDVSPLFRKIVCATLGTPVDLMDLRLVCQNFHEKVAIRKAEFEALMAQEREQIELDGGAFLPITFQKTQAPEWVVREIEVFEIVP